MTPLMTFLVKFIHGDPPGIFHIFGERFFLNTFPKFWFMTSFSLQKISHFHQFLTKLAYYDQIDPFNDFLVKLIHDESPGKSFPNYWRKFFLPFSQNVVMISFWAKTDLSFGPKGENLRFFEVVWNEVKTAPLPRRKK